MKRRLFFFVATLALIACTITACGWRVNDPSKIAADEAEDNVALKTDALAERFAEAVRDRAEAGVTRENLAAVGTFWEPDEQGGYPRRDGDGIIYEFASDHSTVSIQVYLRGSGGAHVGPVSTNLIRFGCAQLTATYTTRTITIADRRCPDYLVEGDYRDPEEISLSEVTQAETGRGEWHFPG